MTDSDAKATRDGLAFFAAATSFVAFLFAALGLFVVSTGDSNNSSVSVSAAATPVAITLSEFKITPAALTATAGDVKLAITNSGTQVHNVSIAQLKFQSRDLGAGETQKVDLPSVAAGTYEVMCLIPGHADSGMKATLVVAAAGAGTQTASAGAAADPMAGMNNSATTGVDYAAMDKRMEAGMKNGLDLFTKGNSTKGVGNQKLAPTVEADGTKVFNIESSIVDWEVAPGKTVKAWAYNGMVPGPWIRTEPGDHIKMVLKNSLPVGTDIHTHGITTPFNMDGLAPLTQDFIKPGETFTYEWTNPNHPELGMYHAHDHGMTAVPNGMFAVFQVGDVALPAGRTISGQTLPANLKPTQELPIVLNDAGVIGLSLNGKSYPATAPIAAAPGETLLVHYYNEGLTAHPMHLHHVPQLVVAKDGLALDQPYWADTLNVAPGERYSALVMPTTNDIGVWAWHCHILTHAENEDGLFGMVTALIVADPNKKG